MLLVLALLTSTMLSPLLRLVALLCFRLFDEQMYEGEEGDQHDGDDVQHDNDEVLRSLVNMELIVRKSGDLFNIWAEPPIQPLLKVCHCDHEDCHHNHRHHNHRHIQDDHHDFVLGVVHCGDFHCID